MTRKLLMTAAVAAIALTPPIGIGSAEARGGGFGGGGFHGGGFHGGGFQGGGFHGGGFQGGGFHDGGFDDRGFHGRDFDRGFSGGFGGFAPYYYGFGGYGGFAPDYYGYGTCYLTIYGTTYCY